MGITIGSLARQFYESNRFCTYPTELLDNCSRSPVAVQVNGRLHRIMKVSFERGAMVLVAANAEYRQSTARKGGGE